MSSALLPRIARGDIPAVGEFLQRHTAFVLGLARRYCRDAQDAEDAVQEIFVEVWRSADRFEPERGSELAFLAVIARRRLVDRLRRRTAQPVADPLADPGVVAAEEKADEVELRDEVARAREAMQHLEVGQRQVLELALGHGRTHQEIAAAIGIPLGTVKSHARRGLIRLRQMLGVEPAPRGGES